MKYFLFITMTATLTSCQQKVDREQAMRFATTLYASTNFEIKKKQQEFINTLLEDLKRIKEDDSAKIDAIGLRNLLEEAKQFNSISTNAILKTVEVDEEINLRKKALDENELLKSLYKNEFETIVSLIENKQYDKLDQMFKEFLKREKEVENVQRISREADDEFTKKYDIAFPHDSTN